MRKLFFFAAVAAFSSCGTGDKQQAKVASAASDGSVDYGTPIGYSAKFEMGDTKYAKEVVALWKDFDNNTLNNSKDRFADTVTMEFSGMAMKGTRDSIFNSTQTYRNSIGTVKSSIDAIIPTRSTDKDADWVCIWGTETRTAKDGKMDSTRIHEIWHFNKAGKVDYMSQFIQKPPAKK